MKFESLNSAKFAAFKKSEIQDAFKVLGGTITATTYKSNTGASGNDTIDSATSGNGYSTNQSTGQGVDYARKP